MGRYEIVGELGRGGMAVVHLARAEDGKMVALKELAGFHSGDDKAAERFLREALVGSSLSHPNIVAVVERLENGGTPFIVMEWVDGGTLRPLVGELSHAQLGGVLEGVLGALAHAGRQGIIHRDMKPENVMLTKDGIAKVADFGIAKAKTVVEGMDGRLTRTGTAVGTPGYMAPEQAMGQDVTPATDLYAAGCIAFEAMTGRIPFAGEAPMVMLMSHASKDVPDLRSIDPLIAPGIADWVAQMTARNPDDRFSDGDAAWLALEAALVEAIGPEWREQSKIVPAPPDVAPPAEGPVDLSTQAPGGDFRTFAAPIALHEQLAAERGEQVPVAAATSTATDTPPPHARVSPADMKAAVRNATPPPRPAFGAAGATGATVAEPSAPARSRRPLIIGGVVAGVVVIAGVAIAVSSGGGGGGSSTTGLALSVDGVTVHAPSGWTSSQGSAVAGIPVAASAAPAGAGSGDGVALLAAQGGRGGLLPPQLASALPPGPQGVTTSSGARGVAFPGIRTAGGADVIALPLANGRTLTIVCRGSAAVSACPSVAQSATGALAPAPSATDTGALQGALALQAPAIRTASRDMTSAHTASAQASAADALSRVLANQAHAVSGAKVGPAARAAATTLAGAYGALANAWAGYAQAARSGGDRSAPAAVTAAKNNLASAGAALGAMGLSLGSGFTTGPAAPKLAAPSHHSSGGSSSGGSSSGSSSSGGSSSGSSSSGSSSSGSSSSGSSSSGSSSSGSSSSGGSHSTTSSGGFTPPPPPSGGTTSGFSAPPPPPGG